MQYAAVACQVPDIPFSENFFIIGDLYMLRSAYMRVGSVRRAFAGD